MNISKIKIIEFEQLELTRPTIPLKKYEIKHLSTRSTNRSKLQYFNHRQSVNSREVSDLPINMQDSPFFSRSPKVIKLLTDSHELMSPFKFSVLKSGNYSFFAPPLITLSKLPSLKGRSKSRLKRKIVN